MNVVSKERCELAILVELTEMHKPTVWFESAAALPPLPKGEKKTGNVSEEQK